MSLSFAIIPSIPEELLKQLPELQLGHMKSRDVVAFSRGAVGNSSGIQAFFASFKLWLGGFVLFLKSFAAGDL